MTLENKDMMKAEVPRFVYERLKSLDAPTFRKVLCALLDRAFYFNLPVSLDADEAALYEAYLKYFPRLSPPLHKDMPPPPKIAVKHGKAVLAAADDVTHLRYFISNRLRELEADLGKWQAYPLDEAAKEDGDFTGVDVEYGDTIHAVAVRDGLASETASHEVTAEETEE